jgi:hypothetical protein
MLLLTCMLILELMLLLGLLGLIHDAKTHAHATTTHA